MSINHGGPERPKEKVYDKEKTKNLVIRIDDLLAKNSKEPFIETGDADILDQSLRILEIILKHAKNPRKELKKSYALFWDEQVENENSELYSILNRLEEGTGITVAESSEAPEAPPAPVEEEPRKTKEVVTPQKEDLEKIVKYAKKIHAVLYPKNKGENKLDKSQKTRLEEATYNLANIGGLIQKGGEEEFPPELIEFWNKQILNPESALNKLVSDKETVAKGPTPEIPKPKVPKAKPPEKKPPSEDFSGLANLTDMENKLNKAMDKNGGGTTAKPSVEGLKEKKKGEGKKSEKKEPPNESFDDFLDGHDLEEKAEEIEKIIGLIKQHIGKIGTGARGRETAEDQAAFEQILKYLRKEEGAKAPNKREIKRWQNYQQGRGDAYELVTNFNVPVKETSSKHGRSKWREGIEGGIKLVDEDAPISEEQREKLAKSLLTKFTEEKLQNYLEEIEKNISNIDTSTENGASQKIGATNMQDALRFLLAYKKDETLFSGFSSYHYNLIKRVLENLDKDLDEDQEESAETSDEKLPEEIPAGDDFEAFVRNKNELGKRIGVIERLLEKNKLELPEITMLRDAIYSLQALQKLKTGEKAENKDIELWQEFSDEKGELFKLMTKLNGRPIDERKPTRAPTPPPAETPAEVLEKKDFEVNETNIERVEKQVNELMGRSEKLESKEFLQNIQNGLNELKIWLPKQAEPINQPAYLIWLDYRKPEKLQADWENIEGIEKKAAPVMESESPVLKVKKGDLVQWVSTGVTQWDKPRRIKGFSDDNKWAFFEESPTGIPVDQLELMPEERVRVISTEEPSPQFRSEPPVRVKTVAPEKREPQTQAELLNSEHQWMVDEKLEVFGINKNEFRSIEGFKEIENDPVRQVMVLKNLEQIWYRHVQEESTRRHEQYVQDGGWFLSKAKRNFLREKRIAEHRDEIAREGFQLKNFQEDAKNLIHLAAIGPKLTLEERQDPKGREGYELVAEYLDVDFIKENNIDIRQAYEFNLAASRFASQPTEQDAKHLRGNNKRAYEKYRLDYEKQRSQLLNILCRQRGLDPESEADGMAAMNSLDFGIRMHQTLIQHPEVEKELQKLNERKPFLQALGGGFALGAGTRILQAGLRFGTKSSLIAAGATGAIPIAGAILSGAFGYWRGKAAGRKTLEQRDKDIRERRVNAKYQAYDKNFTNVESLYSKLKHSRERLENATDEKDRKELEDALRARIFYTRKKLTDETIVFGTSSDGLGKKLSLLQEMSNAEVEVHIAEQVKKGSRKLTRIETLNRVLQKDFEKMEEERKKYISKRGKIGAITGVAGAFVGYKFAEAFGYFVHDHIPHFAKLHGVDAGNKLGNNTVAAIKGNAAHVLTQEELKALKSPYLPQSPRSFLEQDQLFRKDQKFMSDFAGTERLPVSPEPTPYYPPTGSGTAETVSPQAYQATPPETPSTITPREVVTENIARTREIPRVVEKSYILNNERQSRESSLINYLVEEKKMPRSQAGQEAHRIIHQLFKANEQDVLRPVHTGDAIIISERADGQMVITDIPKSQVQDYLNSPSRLDRPGTHISEAATPPPEAPEANLPAASAEDLKSFASRNFISEEGAKEFYNFQIENPGESLPTALKNILSHQGRFSSLSYEKQAKAFYRLFTNEYLGLNSKSYGNLGIRNATPWNLSPGTELNLSANFNGKAAIEIAFSGLDKSADPFETDHAKFLFDNTGKVIEVLRKLGRANVSKIELDQIIEKLEKQ